MILDRLALLTGALRGLREPPPPRADPDEDADPRARHVPHDPRAELVVALLLLLTAAGAIAFAVLLVADGDTQALGATLGGALACLAAALIVAGKRIVPQEVEVEERVPLEHPDDDRAVPGMLRDAGEGISRRRLLAGAAGAAGAGLAAAAVVPASSLGPGASGRLGAAPWRRGTPLVHDDGRAVRADELELGSFLTAYPDGADPRELGSPVVVVRIAEGLRAFSKICTHAGCAVSLFRYPTDEQTSQPPALVCPCHYSTFDVRRGAKPVFGPAVRPLPQLPLHEAPDGTLVAAGPMSAAVGPSWWGVDRS
jgi:ubiquinol-cytochrome c reductase iron-sulfur subunit